jgi:hypothetical protein
MSKCALPILQKCETSKNKEIGESSVLDLIGRLSQNQATTTTVQFFFFFYHL